MGEVFFARSGEEGLEVAMREVPDLILLDIVMPGMDGYQTCERLRTNDITRGTPVIFISALDSDAEEIRGLDLGAVDYISKPFRPAAVRARVRNHLELKRHRDLLESLSALDGLTGLANRRRFSAVLEREWHRARRLIAPLALIMADIDHFKAYNDGYGHLAGDDCLKRVATVFGNAMHRATDLAARYGGEEFVCILPDTDLAGAFHVAEAIRADLAALALPHAYSPTASRVTFSAGIASLIPGEGVAPTTLMDQADQSLYAAKQNGRNRIFPEVN